MTAVVQGLPPVVIERWAALEIPDTEFKNAAAFLALKTGKAVRIRAHRGRLQYSRDCVNVEFATDLHCVSTPGIDYFEMGGREFTQEGLACYARLDEAGKDIWDDCGTVLAQVFHNNIVFMVNFAEVLCEVSTHAIPYVLDKALQMLDFQVEALVEEERKAQEAVFREVYLRSVRERLREKEAEIQEQERKSARAYDTIIDAESRKLTLAAEVAGLKSFVDSPPEQDIRRQVASLSELESSGQYSKVIFQDNGSVDAVTTPVEIEHSDHFFDMGRYSVFISPRGSIKIENLDKHPNANHPHPHVGTDGVPCLGNISADIARMLGRMQMAEALQLLREFLSSYNPDNPYESISRFDPSGEFVDQDDDPCQGCDDSCTPRCIATCRHNDSAFVCSDCCELRTDYCYEDCVLNERFEQFCPCDYCDYEQCIHDECANHARAVELGIRQAPTDEEEGAESAQPSQPI